jgi:hypothetical protein
MGASGQTHRASRQGSIVDAGEGDVFPLQRREVGVDNLGYGLLVGLLPHVPVGGSGEPLVGHLWVVRCFRHLGGPEVRSIGEDRGIDEFPVLRSVMCPEKPHHESTSTRRSVSRMRGRKE